MIKKVIKRLGCICLIAAICCTNVNTTFAAEKTDIIGSVAESRSTTGSIPSNVKRTFYLQLDPYVGLSKTFLVNATSKSATGALFIRLTSPRGNVVSNDWVMGVNEVAQWKINLPSSGQWTVEITATGTTAIVNVFLDWI